MWQIDSVFNVRPLGTPGTGDTVTVGLPEGFGVLRTYSDRGTGGEIGGVAELTLPRPHNGKLTINRGVLYPRGISGTGRSLELADALPRVAAAERTEP